MGSITPRIAPLKSEELLSEELLSEELKSEELLSEDTTIKDIVSVDELPPQYNNLYHTLPHTLKERYPIHISIKVKGGGSSVVFIANTPNELNFVFKNCIKKTRTSNVVLRYKTPNGDLSSKFTDIGNNLIGGWIKSIEGGFSQTLRFLCEYSKFKFQYCHDANAWKVALKFYDCRKKINLVHDVLWISLDDLKSLMKKVQNFKCFKPIQTQHLLGGFDVLSPDGQVKFTMTAPKKILPLLNSYHRF